MIDPIYHNRPLPPDVLADAHHDTVHCGPTHHNACNCREAYFAALRAEVARLREALTDEGHTPTNMQMWVARSLKAEDMVLGLQTELAKRDEPLRPALAAFALAMEAKLKANDHKGGWAGCDEHWLMDRLYEEADELCDAINKGDPEAVAPEAADVANFAMMIHDAAIHHSMEWLEGVATKNWNHRPIEDALRAEVERLKVAEGEAMLVVESQDASIAALKAELAKYTEPLTYEQAAIVCNDYRLGVLTEGDVDEIDAAIRRVRAQSMNEAGHE